LSPKIHRFCKIILQRSAVNNVAALELLRDSRRGKVVSTISKYWLRLLRMDSLEIVRACCEWQITQPKGRWPGKETKAELEKNGFSIYLAKPI
jgi:hypothetical protein